MRRLLLTLLLAGCASTGDEAMLRALQNLEHCDRTYTVSLGMGASGLLSITCKAR